MEVIEERARRRGWIAGALVLLVCLPLAGADSLDQSSRLSP